jgi:hypothetical protein
MRATVACFVCLAAMGSMAFATPQGGPTPTHSTPTYYLRGYYKLDNQRPTWQDSDSSPWSQVKTSTPWVNPRLVKWGYVPFTHDSKNYYCLIEEGARTGSQWLFQNNWRPSVPLIGGGPPLESSFRPRPSNGS